MFRLDFLGGILYGIFANGIFWWDSFGENVFVGFSFCAIVFWFWRYYFWQHVYGWIVFYFNYTVALQKGVFKAVRQT